MVVSIVNNKKLVPFLLFFTILSFSLWSNPDLKPIYSPDSYGYWSLAKNFQHEVSEIRPPFFPLLIKLCLLFSKNNWDQILSLIQVILHTSIATLLFFVFKGFYLREGVCFILSLLIGFNPNLLYYSNYVLADHLLAILTTLAWYFTYKCNNQSINVRQKLRYIIAIGIFSGLAIITKPIAILMVIPIIFSIIALHKINFNMVKTIILILTLNFSFHLSWNYYKGLNNPNLKFDVMNFIENGINMTALRAGLVKYGEGTPLYEYIEKNNLMEEAQNFKIKMSYTMDTQPNYMDFKGSLTWEVANDKQFAMQILKKAPMEIFLACISNWHSFFTKRCFYPNQGSFPGMPDSLRYIYLLSYSLLYRPILLILIIAAVYIFKEKKLLNILYLSAGLTLYASLSTAMLTPHGGEFPRYRVWIEYILWFCSLLPLGFLFQTILDKIKWKNYQS